MPPLLTPPLGHRPPGRTARACTPLLLVIKLKNIRALPTRVALSRCDFLCTISLCTVFPPAVSQDKHQAELAEHSRIASMEPVRPKYSQEYLNLRKARLAPGRPAATVRCCGEQSALCSERERSAPGAARRSLA